MKPTTLAFSLIVASVCFNSCKSHDAISPKQDSLAKNPNQSLAGQLYFFAPEYDSTNYVATGACDCCSANTLFVDDSVFLYIDYCDEGCSYLKGIYRVQNNELSLNFDKVTVEKSYAGSDVKDSAGNLPPDIYSTVYTAHDKQVYKKLDYKGRVVFTGSHVFGAIDTGGTAASFMKSVKTEGIWDRLTEKTKIVNQRAPAAAMPDLLGIWAGSGDQNASFEIRESTIFYPDGSKEYNYELKDDSIRIIYDNYKPVFKVSMKGTDTLIFEEHERQVFHRFKG